MVSETLINKFINKRTKKSMSTLMSLVGTIVVFIAIFTVMFLWLVSNANDAGVTVDTRYNESYDRVIEQQGQLNETVTDIQDKLEGITEADNVVQVAWNGMQFLGTTILATKDFVDVTIGSFSAVADISSAIGVSPSIIALITIVLIAFVVFLVIANLKGEPKMID